jgi:hypothetical protein
MGTGDAWQTLDLETVARHDGCVFGVKGDVVAMNGLVGKLGVEIAGVAEGARRMKVVDDYGACAVQRFNM